MVWSTPSDQVFHCFLTECKNLNKIKISHPRNWKYITLFVFHPITGRKFISICDLDL